MFNLIKKDYLFTKKTIFFSLLYCIAVPIIIAFDNDGNMFLADLLIPLALVTAPLAKIMSKEDTKSGVIFQKTLPYSSYEKIGARFIFVISLLIIGNIFLNVMKQILFRSQKFEDTVVESIPVFIGFAVYYAVYMTVYYWKGYFASQFCIYLLIVIIIFGKNLMNEQVIEVVATILDNKAAMCVITIGVLAIFYFLSCIFEQKRKLDT